MTDSMTKYNHRMTAEESISNFIQYLEDSGSTPLDEEQKVWLYSKGFEIFDTYYIDEVAAVDLATQKDKDKLMVYFEKVQETIGKMFAHIMLVEFKLYIITRG